MAAADWEAAWTLTTSKTYQRHFYYNESTGDSFWASSWKRLGPGWVVSPHGVFHLGRPLLVYDSEEAAAAAVGTEAAHVGGTDEADGANGGPAADASPAVVDARSTARAKGGGGGDAAASTRSGRPVPRAATKRAVATKRGRPSRGEAAEGDDMADTDSDATIVVDDRSTDEERTAALDQAIARLGPEEPWARSSAAAQELLRLWLVASEFDALSAFTSSREVEARLHVRAFMERHAAIRARGWWFDPNTESFTRYFPEIDVAPRHVWFLQRPLGGGVEYRSPYGMSRRYSLRVVHPKTRQRKQTVSVLERVLPRRLFDAVPRSVCFVAPPGRTITLTAELPAHAGSSGPAAAHEHSDYHPGDVDAPGEVVLGQAEVKPHFVLEESAGAYFGVHMNDVLSSAAVMASDLVVLDLRTAEQADNDAEFDAGRTRGTGPASVHVDPFIPTYPVILRRGILCMTPLQLLQANGVDDCATPTVAVAFFGLVARIANRMGAVIVGQESRADVEAGLARVLDRVPHHPEVAEGGLVIPRGVRPADGRCIPCASSLLHAVPPAACGAASEDFKILISTALIATTPKVLVGLGSWYGGELAFAKQSLPELVIYALDPFRNPAACDQCVTTEQPTDKLALLHPPLETFLRNMSDAGGGDGSVIAMQTDIYEGLKLLASGSDALQPEVVVISCEKRTKRLGMLLSMIRSSWPRAVLVGSGLYYESVKLAVDAVEHTALSGCYLVKRDDAFAVFPDSTTRTSELVGKAIRSLEAVHRRPAERVHLHRMVERKSFLEAVAFARSTASGHFRLPRGVHALHVDIPGSVGERLLHEIARTRDRSLVPMWSAVMDCAAWRAPIANSAGLTPFDYIGKRIHFE